MSSSKEELESAVVITERALREIEGRLKVRFRAYFRPGERLRLETEDEQDFVFCKMVVSRADESLCLELEAAVIAQDQEPQFLKGTTSMARLLGAIEFLSQRLEEYFKSQRQSRFHIDWRLYPFEAATVRFRGGQRHPDLEDQASALLGEDDEEDRW